MYTPDKNVPDVRKYLHPANMAIQKKVSLDRNAVYHYPIVRHQTSYYGRLGQDYNIATLG